MNIDNIKNIVKLHSKFQKQLFCRGFYFTDDDVNDADYPFYTNWKKEKIGLYTLLVHHLQRYCIKYDKYNKHAMILIGHAYNPFSLQYNEQDIIDNLLTFETNDLWDVVNEFTGIFTIIKINLETNELLFFGDATCTQCNFYGIVNNHFYLASHEQLLGDILNLKIDKYVEMLVNYKFYPLLGNFLPGDLSKFREFKRLVPNHYVVYNKDIYIKRFYLPAYSGYNFDERVDKLSHLLNSNMKLICKKFNKPAISLTGGCDSKTTLACAKGYYDKYKYFSYISSMEEEVDAKAARDICKKLNLKHKIYNIPNDNDEIKDLYITRNILLWNCGNMRKNNENDVRKRHFFLDVNDFDVEVKSWVSEIGRAYFSKRFANKTNFGLKPTARKCTTMYKFFLHNRKLVRLTNRIFDEYINKYLNINFNYTIPWQEIFFWEFRVSSWNARVITNEHKYSFDITIPYNNRKIIELLFDEDINNNMNDRIHKEIRNHMNPDIDKTGISVVNVKHTSKRAKIERLYYDIHGRLPL